MKKNRYLSYVVIPKAIVYYNAFSDRFIILKPHLHQLYQQENAEQIKNINLDFYNLLVENECLIEDNVDEYKIAEFRKLSSKMDNSLYHIVINTTLDCNLSCWYCYEHKIPRSDLQLEVSNLIKKNITEKYKVSPFRTLKLSFFGGEPFLNFSAIKDILSYAKAFCESNNIHLIADFTSNATLITEEHIIFLRDYHAIFQITLDGYRNKHNKVRKFKDTHEGSYDIVLQNIRTLIENIEQSYVWIRINFDNRTLLNISDILEDIKDLDKNKCSIILRKIWQVSAETIDHELIVNAISLILKYQFFIDYYALPKTQLCFAERMNQALINYDGKIFKCSTLECFDETHTEGTLLEDGTIKWDINKLATKLSNKVPESCLSCSLYAACYGPCSQSLLNPSGTVCFLDQLGISKEEYLMYNFKLRLLHHEFHKE